MHGILAHGTQRRPAVAQHLLDVRRMSKHFSGLTAVDDVSLHVDPGSITSLIGPNGAGKTTFFNCLSGVLEPSAGAILFDGRDISRLPMHRRARLGIGRTFQRLEVFTGMTLENNLLVAAESHRRTQIGRWWRRRNGDLRHPQEVVGEVIDRIGLDHIRHSTAGDLSTGTLRLAELGRALCTQPRLLLLDEPGSGLDSTETQALRTTLLDIAASGIGILLVEHDVEFVMALSETIYVVDFGQLIDSGTPAQISQSEAVRKAYLGEDGNGA